MGTGELRRIHSRVSWMFFPVERSITVSAPQRMAQTSFSTSSSIEEVTAELPMLALIFTRKLRPMIIGSLSGWLTFDGMIARPRATSSRTNSGVISRGMPAPQDCPGCWATPPPQARPPHPPPPGPPAQRPPRQLPPLVLADGDEFHLGGDDPQPRVVHLGDVGPRLRAEGTPEVREAHAHQLGIVGPAPAILRGDLGQLLDV